MHVEDLANKDWFVVIKINLFVFCNMPLNNNNLDIEEIDTSEDKDAYQEKEVDRASTKPYKIIS